MTLQQLAMPLPIFSQSVDRTQHAATALRAHHPPTVNRCGCCGFCECHHGAESNNYLEVDCNRCTTRVGDTSSRRLSTRPPSHTCTCTDTRVQAATPHANARADALYRRTALGPVAVEMTACAAAAYHRRRACRIRAPPHTDKPDPRYRDRCGDHAGRYRRDRLGSARHRFRAGLPDVAAMLPGQPGAPIPDAAVAP